MEAGTARTTVSNDAEALTTVDDTAEARTTIDEAQTTAFPQAVEDKISSPSAFEYNEAMEDVESLTPPVVDCRVVGNVASLPLVYQKGLHSKI